jgi:haloacetate dehalogenase
MTTRPIPSAPWLDHPQAVRRLTIMDIISTGEVWARADRRFALGSWHWSFLV